GDADDRATCLARPTLGHSEHGGLRTVARSMTASHGRSARDSTYYDRELVGADSSRQPDERGALMRNYNKLYIAGRWVEPAGTGSLDVIDATSEEVFATIPDGAPEDID